jgi:LmbE family N-acetylglucosaminyl deacetylase
VTTSTIVFFHAHPDDEALISAGTIARAVDAGHRVVLILATDGGAGRCDPNLLGDGETLGQRRWAEAEDSAAALGVSRIVHLGYSDSGFRPVLIPSTRRFRRLVGLVNSRLIPARFRHWPAGSLCAADPSEVAEKLASILSEEHAELLVADDSIGGYGHPDHLAVHRSAAAASAHLGIPFIQVTVEREFLTSSADLAKNLGLEVPKGFALPDMSRWYTPRSQITHTVDVSSCLSRKRLSMAAHQTQASTETNLSVRTMAVFLSFPDDIFELAFGTEWFIVPDELPAQFSELFSAVTT